METNQPKPNAHKNVDSSPLFARLAWVPVPLLALAIASLWIADLRTAHESRALMVLLNVVFTWLASLCICLLTARGFLGSGQPGLLMFGCGSLLWGVTSLAAAMIVDRVNPTITVHNLGVMAAALCHLVGWLWRGRLPRPGQWLVVGYVGALLTAALIFWAATAGLTPVFFVQGQGGTPVRQLVLFLAVAMFGWVAWRMIGNSRRQAGAFYYWYGLGLALVATGLTGVMLLAVQGGVLGWTNRLTQYLGSAYLFIAAFIAVRESGTWAIPLPPAEEAWRENPFLASFRQQTPMGWVLRYGLAVGAVAGAMGARWAMERWVGPGLPPYITFYPMVMVVALLGGLGPGLLATILAGLAACCWILPPVGHFYIVLPVDRLGLVIFGGMGLFVSVLAEFARRYRHKAAAFDREAAVRESQARLATFAEATFEGIVESDAGRIVDCNEQFARMSGYSVSELKGVEIASLVVPEDRVRVMANIQDGRESVNEHAMLHKDGTRILVETHGRPVSPGSPRRHTAVRDVTERKLAEAALRASEALLRAVTDNSPDPIFLKDRDGRMLLANSATLAVFGKRAEEVLGRTDEEIYNDPAIGRLMMANDRRVMETGQAQEMEEVVPSPSGPRTFLSAKTPYRDAEGRVTGVIGIARDITGRKETEAALRESEERYRLLFQSLQEGFYLAEAIFDDRGQCCDGLYLDVNPAFERIMGRPRDQIIGKRVKELVPELNPEWLKVFGKVTQTGQAASHQAYSEVFQQHVEAFVFRPLPGRFGVLVTDITERKRAEAALRESRERLDLALTSSGMATFDWDIVKNKRTWSAALHSLLGTNPETFTGTAEEFYQVIHPADRSTVQAALARAVETSGQYETEYRAVWPDGSTRHISARGTVHRDSAGRADHMTGVCWDITERKRAEEGLARQREELQLILDSAPAMIFYKDRENHFLRVNRAFADSMGLPKEQLEGRSLFELYPRDQAEAFWRDDQEVLASGQPKANIIEPMQTSAGERWVQTSKVPCRDARGNLTGVIGFALDITERKRAEAEIRRHSEELQTANEELTRFNRVTVGRELRIIELKQQVNELCARLGQPPRYGTEPVEETRPQP